MLVQIDTYYAHAYWSTSFIHRSRWCFDLGVYHNLKTPCAIPAGKKSTKKIYKATRLNTNTDIYYDHVAWFLPLACDVCMHATLSAIYVRVICIMIICTSYKIIELFQSFEISPARAYINRNDIGPFFQGKISIMIYFLGLSAYKYI